MTEHDRPESQAEPVVKVARDLTEIMALAECLEDQAEHKANDRDYLPGGAAMVALAHVGSPEEYVERIAAADFMHVARCPKASHVDCRYAEHVGDDDGTEPPLQTLLFWSEQWRTQHGADLGDRRPTLDTEASFIRWMLNWAWDNEPHWDDFARDVNQARVRLENLLYAGRRSERSRVTCTFCPEAPRLVKVYRDNHADDHFRCPACRHQYDDEGFQRAFAAQLRSQGAEKFVPLRDALDTLHAQGRPKRTIRKWFAEEDVETHRDPVTHAVYVWWPDLWTLHLTTATRQRTSA